MNSENKRLISKNFYNIKEIEVPTPEEITFAISKNCHALEFVSEKYLLPEHYTQAIKKNPFMINQVPDQLMNEGLESLAMELDIDSFKEINNPSFAACQKAIAHDLDWFRFIPSAHQTKEMCEKALSHDGENLLYIKNQTPEYCLIAIAQSPNSFSYVTIVDSSKDVETTKQLLLSKKYILDNLR